jgi:FkbM family methyltransferase
MRLPEKIIKGIKNPAKAMSVICEKYLEKYNGFSYEFFKNGEVDVLKKPFVFKMKTVFDVGSNVGDWASIANEYLNPEKIHFFELSEKTFKTLSGNLIGDQYILNNIGLSNISGKVTYKDNGVNSGVNTLVLDVNFHDSKVMPALVDAVVMTGAKYCLERNVERIDFLKIDVEGAEHLVLEGFTEQMKSKAIKVIQFEYGYANGDAKFLMKDFYKLLVGCGYIIGKIRPGKVEFGEWTYRHNDFNSGPNYIAVINTEKEIVEALSDYSHVRQI